MENVDGNGIEFVTIHEVDTLLAGNRDAVYRQLNNVLGKVYKKAMEDSVNKAIEGAIRYTPELTAKLIKIAIANKKIVDKFYSDNPEFVKYKDIVQNEVFKVESENPGKTYEEILEMSVPKIKEKIALANGSLQTSFNFTNSLDSLDKKAHGII